MEIKNWTYEEYPEYVNPEFPLLESSGEEIGVQYFKDVVYAKMPEGDLRLQIMIPFTRNQPDKVYPCFVYVQGSAWKKQHIHMPVPFLAKLAERGYVTAIVEYRHSGIAAFPSPVIDTKNAVRFLRMNAKAYKIDPDRMILAGSSSGGHTAVYAGFTHNDKTADNLFPGISAETSGIVNYYGSCSFMFSYSNPTTVNHLCPDSPEGLEVGGIDLRENEEMRRRMSAECNIDEHTRIAPMLIFHGTKDRIVHPECSERLYTQMKMTGHDVTMYLIKGADHGGAEFWSDEVLDLVEQFMQKCFLK